MRAFVALDFDEKLKRRLYDIGSIVKSNASRGVWVKKENFHLTLKFLGEIDEMQVESIGNLLESISSSHSAISLKLDDLGFFNKRKDEYGVIWLGIGGDIDILNEIYDIVEDDMESLGFRKERRPFRPHITLGRRVVLNKPFIQIQQLADKSLNYNFLLDKLVLMRSEEIMGKRIYTPVKSYRLKNDHR
jgi:2'-5' RNA ligase